MELGLLHSIVGECWKPIKDFPNYRISNKGRVYSAITGKILIQCRRKSSERYLYVNLCGDNGERKKTVIHRLVAEAFLFNPDNLPCVNHKDENPENNFVENLEWCTHQYNSNYGSNIEKRIRTRIRNGNTTSVIKYDRLGNPMEEFASLHDAARSIGNPNGQCNILNCCKGNKKSAYGFVWKYKEAA